MNEVNNDFIKEMKERAASFVDRAYPGINKMHRINLMHAYLTGWEHCLDREIEQTTKENLDVIKGQHDTSDN